MCSHIQSTNQTEEARFALSILQTSLRCMGVRGQQHYQSKGPKTIRERRSSVSLSVRDNVGVFPKVELFVSGRGGLQGAWWRAGRGGGGYTATLPHVRLCREKESRGVPQLSGLKVRQSTVRGSTITHGIVRKQRRHAVGRVPVE